MKLIKIQVLEFKELSLTWESGEERNFPLKYLRKYCPCATCEQDRSEWSKTYIPIFLQNQITISEIQPVGNYAFNIIWNDGHRTGIYEHEKLRLIEKERIELL